MTQKSTKVRPKKYDKSKKVSPKQLKRYWGILDVIESMFHKNVYALEKKMAKETGIKDIEFFRSDDGICGIGSVDRTMKLIHRH